MTTANRAPDLRGRALGWLARFVTRCFFRSVEVSGSVPGDGPVVLAASHLNGFVDPVVLGGRLHRFPRFLAKSTLWKVVAARPALAFARVIPVHRRQDASGPDGAVGGVDTVDAVDNGGMFRSAIDALRGGDLIAIFAEGTTHDDARIRPIRTGAARIAVQAAAAGVPEVRLVPVGISYEDKVAVRGRVLITFGPPVAVPDDRPLLDESGEAAHDVVRTVTDRLQRALEESTPTFRSNEELLALEAAARVTLHDADSHPDGEPVPMSQIADASRVLAAAPEAEATALVTLVARYKMLLGFADLNDRDLVHHRRLSTHVRRLVLLALLIIVLAPLAVAGLFANLLPVALVLVAGLVPRAPVSKGTTRILVGALAFPLTWTVIALNDSDAGSFGAWLRQVTYPADALLGDAPADRQGFLAGLLVFVLVPLLGAVALVLAERMWAFLRGLVAWRTLLDRRGQLPDILARRAEVVAETRRLLDQRPAP